MSFKEKAKNLKRDIPAVFLAMKRKDTPVLAKIFGVITVGYALSPIDIVPDFVPILGYLDDVILLPLLVALTLKFIPREIFEECRQQSEGLWDDGKPKKWYYSIPIVLVWGLLICFAIAYVLNFPIQFLISLKKQIAEKIFVKEKVL